MSALRVILVLVVLYAGARISCHAKILSYDQLNLNEKMALEESERRLALYDHALTDLDHKQSKGHISKDSYQWQTQQLMLAIRAETVYQNAIMVRDPHLAQRAKDVFETMEHAVLTVPIGIGYAVGACPQLLNFLTLIH